MVRPIESKLHETIGVFCRFLRQAGCEVGTGSILNAIKAASIVGVSRRDDFKEALKSCLVTDHKMVSLFDQLFELYWRNPDRMENVADVLRKLFESRLAQAQLESIRRQEKEVKLYQIESFHSGRKSKEGKTLDIEEAYNLYLYSREEILRQKHFEDYTDMELKEAQQMLERFRWDFEIRKLRRLTPGHKRYRLHMRETIRKNIFPSRDFVKLAWRERKKKPRPLVILCDISGSMENYTRMLLHFIYVLANINRKLEAFTFGTRLTRITRFLRRRKVDEAVQLIADSVKDWSGGTRIGETIQTFNLLWARRVLSGGAVVLIISDGWDTGNIHKLEQEIERLQRSCHKLIWLNPNLGYDGYEPLTRGIQAILPHVDNFLPIHNLQSLIELGKVISSMDRMRRPSSSAWSTRIALT